MTGEEKLVKSTNGIVAMFTIFFTHRSRITFRSQCLKKTLAI